MSEWVKCSDRMPNMGDDVIAYYRLSSGKLSWVAGTVDGSDDGLFIDYELDGLDFKDVAYWMPLPPPPESEGV